MSLLVFGINPLVRTIDKALIMPFTVRKHGRALCFLCNDEIAWEIDPDKFGSNTKLSFHEVKDGFTISLENAEYPSTGVRVDFNATLSRESGIWLMNIKFPWLNIRESISFTRWLKEDSELNGMLKKELKLVMGADDSLILPALSGLTLNRNWDLNIFPENRVVLNIFKGDEYYTYAGLSLYGQNIPAWIDAGSFTRASHFKLCRPQSGFSSFGDLVFGSLPVFHASSYPFTETGLIVGKTKAGPAMILWACNNASEDISPVSFTIPQSGGQALSFCNSRFLKEYIRTEEPFVFIADLGEIPQWIGTAGSSFALASSPDYSFFIHGEGKEVSDVDIKGRLVQTRINVAGASSLPVEYSPAPEIHLLQQDPKSIKLQTVSPGQVHNPLNIRRLDDQDSSARWLYLNQEATRVRFRPDRSILFNLIRPNDFLVLQLEFVNFALDGNLLKIDDRKSPSFLIAYFPSQHTREEMFKVSDTPRVPVNFVRAGSSRLVFKVPSDYQPVPLTLEYLLNWDNFELQVNYRARWFNTGRVVGGLLRETLKNLSMVFSAVPLKREAFVRSPDLSLQTREIKVVDPSPVEMKQIQQPMSAGEIRIAISTSPKGVGRMSLSEDNLGNILANPVIETTQVDKIRGAIVNLFQMGAPSKYETSIEAPSWLEISPNQFAGFAHSIGLRDEFGEYDESRDDRIDISDEGIVVPEKPVTPAIIDRQKETRQVQPVPDQPAPDRSRQRKVQPVPVPEAPDKSKVQQVQPVPVQTTPDKLKIQPSQPVPVQTAPDKLQIQQIQPALVQRKSYKAIVSPVLLNISPALLIQQGQLFELWHTRMGIKLASGEIDEDSLHELKTVRVLWSLCANEKLLEKAKAITTPGKKFYSLPEPADLHELVHLTSNYTELRIGNSNIKADPKPVRAKKLMLSGLGAWLDYEFRDDREIAEVSLQAWLHRATMGRDHYVKLVTRGYLFPFGHKAVRLRIGERKIKMIGNVYTAVIIVKEFIVVKQPELYYDHAGNQGFIPFPFQRVEIKDMEKQVDSKEIISGEEILELYEVADPNKPVSFKIELDDAVGRTVRTEVPLVFIEARVKDQSRAVNYYLGSGWNYFSSSQVSKPLAYARSLVPGDTDFETRTIMFGARNINYDLDGVKFYPEIIEASVFIKQLEELTGERRDVRIQLVDDNNLSMVFAKVHPDDKAELVFGDTETSGGFLSPNMAVTGFSKLTGLTGSEIANLDNLIVVAEKIFSLADNIPKIFGVINFVDILLPTVNLTKAVNAIRKQVEQIRNQIEAYMQDILKMMARADMEFKKLDRFLTAISGLLDDKGILGAVQDTVKLSSALGSHGITVQQGTLAEAVNSAVSVGREIAAKGVSLGTVVGYKDNPQGLRMELANAGINIGQQTIDSMLQLVSGLYNDGFEDAEIIAIVNVLGMASSVTDLQSLVKTHAETIVNKILESIPEIPNVKFHVKGDEIIVEYHWKPKTKESYNAIIFEIKNLNKEIEQIEVSVDSIMRKSVDLKTPPMFDVNASIKKFTIIIAKTLQVNFERISFKSGSGSKAGVDVKFMEVPIRLTGSLSFVNSLQKVISSDQFSAGPFIDVSSSGVVAGYNFPLPGIEVGILGLSNMMLGTRLKLPFNKDPLTIGFNFSSRENPFRVLVSCFGGGGFFSMESTMKGLTRLDAAFEFGAGISLDVGVASGSVEAMGGIYYCMISAADGSSYTMTAYLRITGRLSILKLIRITLEFYLEMLYESLGDKTIIEDGKPVLTVDKGSRLVGTASLSVKVEVLFFSKTVKVTVKRTFTGNDADPKFAETYSPEHWQDYCAAFAS